MSARIELNNSLAVANSNEIQISDYLRNIIENKVNGVALTCFEGLVHWFLTTFSCCCSAYNTVYQDREVKSRVKHFSDGTILEDLTTQKIVSIGQHRSLLDQIYTQMGEQPEPVRVENEYIAINGREVIFTPLEGQRMVFGQAYNTVTLVAQEETGIMVTPEGKAKTGIVAISEKTQTSNMRIWRVDTNKSFTKFTRTPETNIPIGMGVPVYVVESAIPRIQDPGYLRRDN